MQPLVLHHPKTLITLMVVSFATAIVGFWLVFHPPATVANNAHGSPVQPVQVPTPKHQISEAPHRPKAAFSHSRSVTPAPANNAIQSGTGNQQTVNQGSITQANSGGCNQQIVGGNYNTTNCEPPERHLTEQQAVGLEKIMNELPNGCNVTLASPNSGEAVRFAGEISYLFRTGGKRRDGPNVIMSSFDKYNSVYLNSPNDICTPAASGIVKRLDDLTIPIKNVEFKAIARPGEFLIFIGEQ
jgi:hypothetical protein